MRNPFIWVIGTQLAPLSIVLPPLTPCRRRDSSKPVVDVHFDDIVRDGCAQVLRSNSFYTDAISLFIYERCENEMSFRAAKIIRAEWSIV